jgi:MFS family permease
MNAPGAALLLLPACLMMLAFGSISGRLSLRFGGRVQLALGVLIAAVGLGLLAASHSSQWAVLGYTTVVFAGIGLDGQLVRRVRAGPRQRRAVSRTAPVAVLLDLTTEFRERDRHALGPVAGEQRSETPHSRPNSAR